MSILEEHPLVVAPATRRDVLHRAADLLEEFGWERVADLTLLLANPRRRKPTCLIGAVAIARHDLGDIRPDDSLDPYTYGFVPLADMFRAYTDAYRWNDAPGRTKAEVVARLRQAAETA